MTVVYALAVGLVVRLGSRTLEFERRLNDGRVVFIDCVDKSPRTWSIGALHKEIKSGKLKIVRGNDPRTEPADAPVLDVIFDVESLPEKHRNALHLKAAYIKALKRAGITMGQRARVQSTLPKIARELNDSNPPRASTVMTWWRKLDRTAGNTMALVNGHASKTPRRRLTWQLAVVDETIRKEYCTRKRISIKDLQASIDRNLKLAAAQRGLPAPEARVSYSTVRKQINQVDGYALDSSRFGAAYANNKWRCSFGGNGCIRAMQRYEIDHTILDIVVICDTTGLPLGRPTITVVIDSYSSYIVGFFISFWGTGLASTFSALKVAFAPKDAYELSKLNIESPWHGMGVCELLVMDNGLEFHSPQMRSLATRIHMDLQYNPVRTPWLKGSVERSLGDLRHLLPSSGRVEKPRDNYIPISPEKTASITFSALCQGLAMAFVDVHANQINQRKLARPIDLFRDSLELLPPPLLLGPTQEIDIVMGVQTARQVGNEGVIIHNLRYNSRELNTLRRQYGQTFTTEIRYLPENIAYIFVRVPASPNWIVVPCCYPEYAHNLSLVQHMAIRGYAKEALSKRNAEDTLSKYKAKLQEMWLSSVRHGKRLKSAQLKGLNGLTSNHALGATPDDLSSSTSAASREMPVCIEDLATPLGEVPLLKSFTYQRGD